MGTSYVLGVAISCLELGRYLGDLKGHWYIHFFFVISYVTVTNFTLFVTVMCSGVLNTTVIVTMAPTYVGLAAVSGQHDVVLPPPLIWRDTIRSVVCLTTMSQQQPQYQMLS